jgi:hypothetical protein
MGLVARTRVEGLVRQAAGSMTEAKEFSDRFDAIERTLAARCPEPSHDMPTTKAEVPA